MAALLMNAAMLISPLVSFSGSSRPSKTMTRFLRDAVLLIKNWWIRFLESARFKLILLLGIVLYGFYVIFYDVFIIKRS